MRWAGAPKRVQGVELVDSEPEVPERALDLQLKQAGGSHQPPDQGDRVRVEVRQGLGPFRDDAIDVVTVGLPGTGTSALAPIRRFAP